MGTEGGNNTLPKYSLVNVCHGKRHEASGPLDWKLGDAPILAFLSRGTQLFARYLLLQSKPPEHSQSVADASAPTDRSLMNLALRSQRLLELEQKVATGGRILASVITLDILEERGVKELEAGTMLRAVARRSSVGF